MSEVSYVLGRYPVAVETTKIASLGAAGGMSGAQFWRFSGPQGPLVLRRWPSEHPDAEQLRFIHAVLGHAAQRGIKFVPLPIATSDGRTFVSHAGHLWELAPWLPGTADYEQTPSPTKLRNALVALGQFHTATMSFDVSVGRQADSTANTFSASMRPCPSIARRWTRLGTLRPDEVGAWRQAISEYSWPELAHTAQQFLDLLPDAVPIAARLLGPLIDVPLPMQPCLRDVWHDHILFVVDEVTGLIDFGALAIDTPAGDVARLLGSLAGDEAAAWHTGLEAYAGVRPLTSDELRAVAALDASGIVLAGCNWIRWICVENRQFENRRQVERRLEQLLDRLQQLVHRNVPVIGGGM